MGPSYRRAAPALIRSVVFVLVVLAFPVAANAAAIARLTLQSQPGDFVGQGQNVDFTYTEANSYYFAAFVFPLTSTAPPQPGLLSFVFGNPAPSNTFAALEFGTDQLGIPMQPGIYSMAQRASFAAPGFAGLDVEFQNNGCNTLTGSFVVTEAAFSADVGGNLTIEHFAATFEQHCNGAAPALRGSFYFDARGVPPPKAPGSSAHPVPALSAIELAVVAMWLAILGAMFLRRHMTK